MKIKSIVYSLVVLSISFIVWGGMLGCDSTSEVKIPPEFEWLKTWGNLKDSTYQEKYEAALKKYMGLQDYENVGYILQAKGNVLDYNLIKDTMYLRESVDFINKYGDQISDNLNLEIRYFVGSQLDFNGEFKESERWLLDAITYAEDHDFSKVAGFAYIILSEQKKKSSKLDSAQIYAYKGLKIFENLRDTSNIGAMQYNLLRIAKAMDDREGAEKALEKMLHYAYLAKDTFNICFSYISHSIDAMNVAHDYERMKSYNDTLSQILNSWSNPVPHFQFMRAYLDAMYFLEKRNLIAADSTITEVERLAARGAHDPYYLDQLKLRYSFLDKNNVSQEFFDKLIETSLKKKDYYQAMQLLKNMVSLQREKSDYKAAYSYLNAQFALRDSLWNDDLKAKLVEFEKKYQTAKKEKQIAEQKQVISKRNNQIILLLSGLLMTLLVSLVYMGYRRRIALRKEKELQEQFTQDLLQNTEDEQARIAGDLHDSVNNYLLQLSNKIKQGGAVELEEVTSAIEKIRAISHDLSPSMFENVGLELSIKNLCQTAMENSSLKIVTQINYDKKLNTRRELQIYRIIQEALNNIMKHSNAKHVFIKVVSQESLVIASVKDDGGGFNFDDKKTSFGITNMIQRAKAIKGKLDFDSNKSGTKLSLEVNL